MSGRLVCGGLPLQGGPIRPREVFVYRGYQAHLYDVEAPGPRQLAALILGRAGLVTAVTALEYHSVNEAAKAAIDGHIKKAGLEKDTSTENEKVVYLVR